MQIRLLPWWLALSLLPTAAGTAVKQARRSQSLILTCEMDWSSPTLAPIKTRVAPALTRLLAERVRTDCWDECGLSVARHLVDLGGEAAPALVDMLALPPDEDCGLAVWALSGIGEEAVEPLMSLVVSADRPSISRRTAGAALMRIAEQQRWKNLKPIPAPASLPKAVEMLHSSDKHVREAGASTLIAFSRTEVVLDRLKAEIDGTAKPATACCDAALIRPLTNLCRELAPPDILGQARQLLGRVSTVPKISESGRAAAKEFGELCSVR